MIFFQDGEQVDLNSECSAQKRQGRKSSELIIFQQEELIQIEEEKVGPTTLENWNGLVVNKISSSPFHAIAEEDEFSGHSLTPGAPGTRSKEESRLERPDLDKKQLHQFEESKDRAYPNVPSQR